MIKRELRINLKSFLIWLIVLISIFGIVFIMYPSIMNSENIKNMEELIKIFPEEMLKMFNMDITSLTSAFGWLKTEGFVLILLIIGMYSAILGSNILLKEENDGTIEYLYAKPISRNKIITSKILVGMFYIILMISIILLFNLVGLSLIEDFDLKLFLLLSISPILICIPIFFISMIISCIFNKTKKTIGISIGIVFISYFLMIISNLSDTTEFFKYFSIYSLGDPRNIILNNNISFLNIIICIFVSLVFIFGIYKIYSRKELV